MARITINNVKTTLGISDTYDLVNAIRNSAGDTFRNYVPLANADNVQQVGQGILVNQQVQNEFVASLIDRIALVVIKNASLQNPLKKFKKGSITDGRTIEEIYTDIIKAQKYDPSDAETTLFKRVMPNVKTLFHDRNRQDVYPLTLQDASLRSAFTSWDNFDSFVTSVLNSIYSSAEVDEFEYMKLLIENYYAKSLFKVVPVTKPNTSTATTDLVRSLRAHAMKMTLPQGTRDYNSLAVRTKSDMSDLHLFIDADVMASMDVDVLAKAFNMDRTTFLGNVTVIDDFSIQNIEAVLVDQSFFMVYDNLHKLESVRNSKGLYWNYFYHVWQTLSTSRFANAVAFVSGTVPAVTQIIVDPVISQLKPSSTYQFNAVVRQTDTTPRTPTWAITGVNGTVVQAGTTISATGLLTVASNQSGELSITAKLTGVGIDIDGAGPDTTDVIGEAIVTIV
jgi:hypothetical protein